MSKPRAHHIAAASWASIYREVQVTAFSRNAKQHTHGDRLMARAVEHIEVREDKRVTVSNKWTFFETKVTR